MIREGKTKLIVQVQPNASDNKVVSFKDGVLHLRIAAPPVKGKANHELIKLLSDILRIRKGNLTISKGITSKRKLIAITGLTQNQVMEQIKKLIM